MKLYSLNSCSKIIIRKKNYETTALHTSSMPQAQNQEKIPMNYK